MGKLSEFYSTAKWRTFRQAVIMQRTNPEDGILYSEYSGKPILSLYDAVLHHVQPLTEKNVDDYAISLNPDNIQIVTHAEHNEIHARFGHCSERKVYLVYGSPLSGKTSFVQRAKGNSDLVIDIDLIWQAITGGERYKKPPALKQNMFGVYNCLIDMVRTRYPRTGWERAWIITGGAVKPMREKLLRDLGAEPIFIDTPKEECLRRLANDTERDRDEWSKYIEQWFKDYSE